MRAEVGSDPLQDALTGRAVTAPFKTWQCANCGFIYDEAEGLPDEGLAPGTRWADVPDSFECPLCGFAKAQFEMVEL